MNVDIFVIVALLSTVASAYSNKIDSYNFEVQKLDERTKGLETWKKTGITGGKNVTIDQIKYIGIVRNSEDDTILGTAIILNKKWILTAATRVNKLQGSEVKIRVGSSYADKGGELLNVEKVYTYPKFNPFSIDFDNNLALIKLEKELKYSKNVRPISFSSILPKDGENVVISGYGEGEETPAGFLVKANVPYLDYEKCAKYFQIFKVKKTNFCTYKAHVAPCSFDWGSPAVYKNKLIGIFSGDILCGDVRLPPVYMNISKFNTWIKATLKK